MGIEGVCVNLCEVLLSHNGTNETIEILSLEKRQSLSTTHPRIDATNKIVSDNPARTKAARSAGDIYFVAGDILSRLAQEKGSCNLQETSNQMIIDNSPAIKQVKVVKTIIPSRTGKQQQKVLPPKNRRL